MKVIVSAEFIHETNRYCPGVTTMQDYKNRMALFTEKEIVEAPALAPQCPESMPLAHSRRPIYPLDDI